MRIIFFLAFLVAAIMAHPINEGASRELGKRQLDVVTGLLGGLLGGGGGVSDNF